MTPRDSFAAASDRHRPNEPDAHTGDPQHAAQRAAPVFAGSVVGALCAVVTIAIAIHLPPGWYPWVFVLSAPGLAVWARSLTRNRSWRSFATGALWGWLMLTITWVAFSWAILRTLKAWN